jgi:hypothetical protein
MSVHPPPLFPSLKPKKANQAGIVESAKLKNRIFEKGISDFGKSRVVDKD